MNWVISWNEILWSKVMREEEWLNNLIRELGFVSLVKITVWNEGTIKVKERMSKEKV